MTPAPTTATLISIAAVDTVGAGAVSSHRSGHHTICRCEAANRTRRRRYDVADVRGAPGAREPAPTTGAEAPPTTVGADERRLAEMGYRQELARAWSGFTNFAISFTIIS